MGDTTDRRTTWTFLTNHARVLLIISADPQTRIRDIAANIGITERAAQSIVTDLEEAGYIERARTGRRNHYTIKPGRHLRHHTQTDIPIQTLIDIFTMRDLPTDDARSALESRHDGHPPTGGLTA
jgi:predicted transcriptional regulator